jgi:hypothetical protein
MSTTVHTSTTSAGPGAATPPLGPLQYMASMTGPVWFVVASLGLLGTAREV